MIMFDSIACFAPEITNQAAARSLLASVKQERRVDAFHAWQVSPCYPLYIGSVLKLSN